MRVDPVPSNRADGVDSLRARARVRRGRAGLSASGGAGASEADGGGMGPSRLRGVERG